MNTTHKNIILFGPPGSGKSTMVEMMRDAGFEYSLISLGVILREITSRDDERGEKIKAIMAKGDLLDDFFVTELVKDALRDTDKSKMIILDGYPRSLMQVNAVDDIFTEEGLDLPILIYIKITSEEAVRRLSSRRVCSKCKTNFQYDLIEDKERCALCGGELVQREDDKPESIKNRFELFEMQFKIIQHHFQSRSRYFEIDGMLDKPGRLEEVLKIISN